MIVGASDCRIRRLKLVKFLGLQVDDTLTWSDHIDYISTKIKWGIFVIKKTSKFLDKNSLLMLHRTLVEAQNSESAIKFDLGIFMYERQSNFLPETAEEFHILNQLKWFIPMKQDQLFLETC